VSQPEGILYSPVGALVTCESCRVDTSHLLSIKGFLAIKCYLSGPLREMALAVCAPRCQRWSGVDCASGEH
jgi:hypothetical protein